MPSAPPKIDNFTRATLSLADIELVSDAFHHASVALMGFQNQPRATNDEGRLTAGGDLVAAMSEWLGEHAHLLMRAAQPVVTDDSKEAERRAWILLRSATMLADSLAETGALAAQLVYEQQEVEFAERHLVAARRRAG